MTTSLKLDHIVIMVDDLNQAKQDYTTLGFSVLEGGTHADNPTHNALIVFADGVYLEIIALQPDKTKDPRSVRLDRWVNDGPGLVDYALLPTDIAADIAAARKRGLPIEGAEPGGRLRPDGQAIHWQTANLPGQSLPFFCADVTPRALRVPEGDIRQHPNGTTGVAEIVIAVRDLAESQALYEALLGVPPHTPPTDEDLSAQLTAFSIDAATITLAQPLTPQSPLHNYLANKHERPYRFTLTADQPPHLGALDLALTHGAHITIGRT